MSRQAMSNCADETTEPCLDNSPPRQGEVTVDRGWAWVVLAMSMLSGFVSLGMSFSMGAYFSVVESDMGASKADMSLLFSLFGLPLLTAPISSTMSSFPVLGYRRVIAGGMLLSSIAYVLNYFATRLWHLYLSWGVLAMLGYGLAYSPSMGIIGHYFERYKYMASAALMVGTGIGSFLFPLFFGLTTAHFGWRLSMLCNAAVCLVTSILVALLMRDPPREAQQQPVIIPLSQRLQLDLFKDARFLLMLAHTLMGASFCLYTSYVARYCQVELRFSNDDATNVLALYGFGQLAGRFYTAAINCSTGALARRLYNRFRVTQLAAIVAAVAHVPVYYSESLMVQRALALGIGFSCGLVLTAWPGILIECFGRESLNLTWGRLMLFSGSSYLLFLPIVGVFVESSGDFRYAFYTGAGAYTAACVLMIAVEVLHRRRLAAAIRQRRVTDAEPHAEPLTSVGRR